MHLFWSLVGTYLTIIVSFANFALSIAGMNFWCKTPSNNSMFAMCTREFNPIAHIPLIFAALVSLSLPIMNVYTFMLQKNLDSFEDDSFEDVESVEDETTCAQCVSLWVGIIWISCIIVDIAIIIGFGVDGFIFNSGVATWFAVSTNTLMCTSLTWFWILLDKSDNVEESSEEDIVEFAQPHMPNTLDWLNIHFGWRLAAILLIAFAMVISFSIGIAGTYEWCPNSGNCHTKYVPTAQIPLILCFVSSMTVFASIWIWSKIMVDEMVVNNEEYVINTTKVHAIYWVSLLTINISMLVGVLVQKNPLTFGMAIWFQISMHVLMGFNIHWFIINFKNTSYTNHNKKDEYVMIQ